jgi:hypothetical protein
VLGSRERTRIGKELRDGIDQRLPLSAIELHNSNNLPVCVSATVGEQPRQNLSEWLSRSMQIVEAFESGADVLGQFDKHVPG